jgi:hypothetical protein
MRMASTFCLSARNKRFAFDLKKAEPAVFCRELGG